MTEYLPVVTLLLAALSVVLLLVLLSRVRSAGGSAREVRDELRAGREEAGTVSRELRAELAGSLATSNEGLLAAVERVRGTLDVRVKEMQESNERKLDDMRRTVDEKLHETLEKRLGESFKLVGERLEAVHRGLGEMQTLASGVGDLRRVLTNVKTRGTWAEVQLGGLLEQVMIPEQYGRNVQVNPSMPERVEFAIRLPGAKGMPESPVWLPIDSKFPQEDYLRLQEAAELGEPDAVLKASDALANAVRVAAREICGKYVCPPHSTDFAIMFLATEGLYAEVLRRSDLVDELQRKYRVVVRARVRSSERFGTWSGCPDPTHRRRACRSLRQPRMATHCRRFRDSRPTSDGSPGGAVAGYAGRSSIAWAPSIVAPAMTGRAAGRGQLPRRRS
jgi:DNA anti-recombination protein RmuC